MVSHDLLQHGISSDLANLDLIDSPTAAVYPLSDLWRQLDEVATVLGHMAGRFLCDLAFCRLLGYHRHCRSLARFHLARHLRCLAWRRAQEVRQPRRTLQEQKNFSTWNRRQESGLILLCAHTDVSPGFASSIIEVVPECCLNRQAQRWHRYYYQFLDMKSEVVLPSPASARDPQSCPGQ